MSPVSCHTKVQKGTHRLVTFHVCRSGNLPTLKCGFSKASSPTLFTLAILPGTWVCSRPPDAQLLGQQAQDQHEAAVGLPVISGAFPMARGQKVAWEPPPWHPSSPHCFDLGGNASKTQYSSIKKKKKKPKLQRWEMAQRAGALVCKHGIWGTNSEHPHKSPAMASCSRDPRRQALRE